MVITSFKGFLTMRKQKTTTQTAHSKMGILAVERRRHPRFVVELPLDYHQTEESDLYGGIVTNASEGGLLVYLPERMNLGTVLKIQIFYVRELEFNMIKAVAKIVWSDMAARESWGEHRYGLQFISIDKDNLSKLMTLLKEVGK
jgi:c-di-GMP-binding flagellar brake protein YcgR